MQQGTLMLSSNRGRYAFRIDGEETRDITSGDRIEIKLGGQWIAGQIWYNDDPIYVTLGPQTLDEAFLSSKDKGIAGYYVEIAGGGIVGLCVGMEVRLLP